jgi:hypothetical protein
VCFEIADGRIEPIWALTFPRPICGRQICAAEGTCRGVIAQTEQVLGFPPPVARRKARRRARGEWRSRSGRDTRGP